MKTRIPKNVLVLLCLISALFIASFLILSNKGKALISKVTSPPKVSITVPGSLVAGPWLVWDGNPNNMYIRIILKTTSDSCQSGTVTVNKRKYSMNPVRLPSGKEIGHTLIGECPAKKGYDWCILQAHITGLPEDQHVNYKIEHPYFSGSPIQAYFRTAPSPNDTNKLTFHIFADNRRYAFSNKLGASDFLPVVEAHMVDSGISSNPEFQTFILHAGDFTAIGQQVDICGIWYYTGDRYVGWAEEYLKSSNISLDWQKHTWLRATVPTIGSPGNHEGKKDRITQTHYHPPDFSLYSLLMENKNCDSKDQFCISYKNESYVAANKVDWGALRIIRLNTYSVMTKQDSDGMLNWLENMIDGRAKNGHPTVLVFHPPLFMRKKGEKQVGEVGNYWKTQKLLEEYVHPVIKHKVPLVITGHVHATGRTKIMDGVTYYIVGGGGAPDLNQRGDLSNTNMAALKPYGDYWYTGPKGKTDGLAWLRCEVDYDKKTITCEIYNLDDKLIDQFEIPFMKL